MKHRTQFPLHNRRNFPVPSHSTLADETGVSADRVTIRKLPDQFAGASALTDVRLTGNDLSAVMPLPTDRNGQDLHPEGEPGDQTAGEVMDSAVVPFQAALTRMTTMSQKQEARLTVGQKFPPQPPHCPGAACRRAHRRH